MESCFNAITFLSVESRIHLSKSRVYQAYILENLSNFFKLYSVSVSDFGLFNIMVNHNLKPFIESLIYPFLHFSWSELTGLTFFVSFRYFNPPTSKKTILPTKFWMVNPKNGPIKQFFFNFIKDNKYVLILA